MLIWQFVDKLSNLLTNCQIVKLSIVKFVDKLSNLSNWQFVQKLVICLQIANFATNWQHFGNFQTNLQFCNWQFCNLQFCNWQFCILQLAILHFAIGNFAICNFTICNFAVLKLANFQTHLQLAIWQFGQFGKLDIFVYCQYTNCKFVYRQFVDNLSNWQFVNLQTICQFVNLSIVKFVQYCQFDNIWQYLAIYGNICKLAIFANWQLAIGNICQFI